MKHLDSLIVIVSVLAIFGTGIILGVVIENNLTALKPQTLYYVENNGNGTYTVFNYGQSAILHTNIDLKLPIGKCESIGYDINLFQKTVILNITEANQINCQ